MGICHSSKKKPRAIGTSSKNSREQEIVQSKECFNAVVSSIADLESVSDCKELTINITQNISSQRIKEQFWRKLDDFSKKTHLLRYLTIYFSFPANSNDDFMELIQIVSNISQLESLDLRVDFFGIPSFPLSVRSIAKLNETLGKLTRLTSFALLLPGGLYGGAQGDPDNQRLWPLYDKLKSTSITTIRLHLGTSSIISDSGLEKLCENLSRVPQLRSLTLLLHEDAGNQHHYLTDKGLIKLGDVIQNLTSLEELSLNFIRCQKISDEGVSRLSESFKVLSRLRLLNLRYHECKEVSDEALVKIGEILADMTQIKELALSFNGCEKIGDYGFENMAQSLGKLYQLEELYVEFKNCPLISFEVLQKLDDQLRNLRCLKSTRFLMEPSNNLRELRKKYPRVKKMHAYDRAFDVFVN